MEGQKEDLNPWGSKFDPRGEIKTGLWRRGAVDIASASETGDPCSDPSRVYVKFFGKS
jgi:hypothetical protein